MLSSKCKFLGALALAAAPLLSQAAPVCSRTIDFGAMAPDQTQVLGRSVLVSGTITDCYTFSVAYGAEAGGTTTEVNASLGAISLFGSIDIWGVELFRDGLSVGAFDNSPESFFFPDLADGAYLLAVSATTTAGSRMVRVTYTGSLSTALDSTPEPAHHVPEPASLGLAALALGAAGLGARRRRGA